MITTIAAGLAVFGLAVVWTLIGGTRLDREQPAERQERDS